MQEVIPDTLAIVGAGNMGNAIASLFFTHGWQVLLIDPSEAAHTKSREWLLRDVPAESGLHGRLEWYASLSAAASSSLVIEAVPEDLSLKHRIFQELEAACAPSTILATNTSGISINQLAAPLAHPHRFIGTHFFTPADVIPLVEVVGSEHTSPETIEQVMSVLHNVGKLPIHVRKDIPGFIANRLQHALAREAMSLLEQGVASAQDIDTVAKWSLGIRLALTGPLEQRDINGLDMHHAIATYLYPELENRQSPCQVLSDKVKQGELGVKSGQGFYDWNTPERQKALRDKDIALRRIVKHIQEQS